MVRSVAVVIPPRFSRVVQSIAGVLQRQLSTRCGPKFAVRDKAELAIALSVRPGIGREGFCIEDGEHRSIRIAGNDEIGLLHGVGRLLRGSRFSDGAFEPSSWRGASVPEKEVRGIYFASHFHNFYHDAPVEAVQRYVEDLGLWGYNALAVWFDMHHYRGIDDPEARKMIERLRATLAAAKAVGMKAGLTTLANEAYANSPQELRADPNTGRAHYHVELCPKKPKGKELILQWHEERLRAFADLKPEYFWIWPYDQGGCACKDCAPWGANGFLHIAEPVAELYRRHVPHGKVVLSTWLFDMTRNEGEWEGLTKAFAKRPDWVDYLMVESHAEFPRYPLEHGVPGGLPMINFPEISMRGIFPWGGFGANPQPAWCQHLWDTAGHLLVGGFPYSEGIFEDINKAVVAQFYWDSRRKAIDTVREYAAAEYSPDVAADAARAVEILERNHSRGWHRGENGEVFGAVQMPPDGGSEEALALLKKTEAQLTALARRTWRWQILLLRAELDAELFKSKGVPTAKCEECFEELTEIFHAEGAEVQVQPPIKSLRQAFRG